MSVCQSEPEQKKKRSFFHGCVGCLAVFGCMVLLVGGCFCYELAKSTLPSEQHSDSRSKSISKQEQQGEEQITYDNLLLGAPGEADVVVDRVGYALGYLEQHKQPGWVIYRLTSEEAEIYAGERIGTFRKDPKIPRGASAADYIGSGYDMGHLAPAADMAWSEKAMGESFYLSNVSPQDPAFNGGIWKKLENRVRIWALEEGELYVVTGPILPVNPSRTIGANKVTVPEYFYKVIYDPTPPEKMIGFIIPNAESNRELWEYAVTVRTVEQVTGLNFFPNLNPNKQAKLESEKLDLTLWFPHLLYR